ncbi:DUF2256 domain-containing protein [Rheinheimera baltica]|uniref:DUF2256 domain-containing protein n=1 Tax=Rheinheimera baltica TaxID=67576 RepID=A0ABT9I1Q1_9GAMM|nr:DUF2256 domain-containing protein [Rheinheimera baltica]MDP5137316.1 DUF2256 domain-containing protein [Rheinheimera baltica]MDP5144256.1 DUF2256 domain-containing protein [Rheinheimera baltica]MDP5151526.1 DUF2256 domain-containing protein [Rheinheimera baltica]MDP5188446.1 DUF2256 domain-containing protein [Rheinheimera baltica]
MAHHKLTLPEKICPVCQLTFSWRKKWQRNWQDVIYCSERCRRNKSTGQSS